MQNQMQFQVPKWWFIVLCVTYLITETAGLAYKVVRETGTNTDATTQCREVAKGSIGWQLPEGVVCVRPVYYLPKNPELFK